MDCPRCGPGTPISVEMVTGGPQQVPGKVYKCEKCSLPFDPPTDDATVAVVPFKPRSAPAEQQAPRPAVAPQQTAPQPAAITVRRKTDPARDLIKEARAQLREINREIKRLEQLRKRRDELKRLLDAAGGKPRAVVRRLQTNTG